jgi:hypothetical protein
MRTKHCASTVIFSLLYIFYFYFYFTTDLYARAVRGNIPLLKDCDKGQCDGRIKIKRTLEAFPPTVTIKHLGKNTQPRKL